MYFDTTENTTKLYSNSAWGDLGGGGKPGQLPTYTTAERDNLEPSIGMIIYNTTTDEIQGYLSGYWRKIVGAGSAVGEPCTDPTECRTGYCHDYFCCDRFCDGDCEQCNKPGDFGHCNSRSVDDNTEVVATCYHCNGIDGTSVKYSGCDGVNCTVTCTICDNGVCVTAPDNTNCGCDLCQACQSGGCVDTASGWGSELYNCTGSDKRCYLGNCISCQGFVYDDGCSGCAGQGGNACWHKGAKGANCTTTCASYGGCVAAQWDDDVDCTVCSTLYGWSGTNCYSEDYCWRPGYYPLSRNRCERAGVGRTSQNCSSLDSSITRMCVCQF